MSSTGPRDWEGARRQPPQPLQRLREREMKEGEAARDTAVGVSPLAAAAASVLLLLLRAAAAAAAAAARRFSASFEATKRNAESTLADVLKHKENKCF